MTDYAIYQSFAVDGSGNAVSGASVEVRSEATGNLVTLFSGRTGGAKGNPFTTDSDGYFAFYTVGDFLKIRVYTGPSGAPTTEKFFRYVAVGLAGGYDLDTIFHNVPAGAAATPGLTFVGDATTGPYLPSAGIWALSSAGVERLRFDASGQAGFGAAAATATSARFGKSLTGAITSIGVRADGTIQSGVTTAAAQFQTIFGTVAAAFTLVSAYHFQATQGTIGAASAITSQYGFYADSTLTGATNNYGFYSNIASAANRWNFYGAGTGRNFLQGQLSIGASTDPGTGGLHVEGNFRANGTATVAGNTIMVLTGGQTITGGFAVTPNNIGTVSSGTTTPAMANGNYQFYTNNGAHTLAAPTTDGGIDVLVTNGASAGAITFSGFTVAATVGDSLTTVNTNKFIISIRRINSVATYTIKALQ